MFKSITKFPVKQKKQRKQRKSDESQQQSHRQLTQKEQQDMIKRRKSLDNFHIQNDLQFILQDDNRKKLKRKLKKSQIT